ncbi:hypothetical protein MINTM003_24260 [Mycobacterium paraintracellulare]|uniref:PPE family protein n=1 Tax=Mycobacterium indicus pranii (strain DSM 45239 / MTCC 9506) TaxID=1232724 RepID=J9WGL4_MYCIP|nr:PPE family protein [Mycobacterium intracellulare subsp. intracellulare MTCC 9506]BCO51985.1 hypothetical protein MINTM003_24260 [Mycobacterium paraintracellulare]
MGQNGAAIAATEIEYAQMWSQDFTAMSSYASSSEAAGKLTPFQQAPATTKDTGQTAQAPATAAAGSAGKPAAAALVRRVAPNVVAALVRQVFAWSLVKARSAVRRTMRIPNPIKGA